jgi:hypothetical protein
LEKSRQHSSQVAESSRILGAVGLLQVAPVATWADLGGPTLVRLIGQLAVVDGELVSA